jgi:hypothetical protein
VGEKLILEGNVSVEQVFPSTIERKLSAEEMSVYQGTFSYSRVAASDLAIPE